MKPSRTWRLPSGVSAVPSMAFPPSCSPSRTFFCRLDQLLSADVPRALDALHARVDAAVAELRTIDVATLGDFRGIGRARLPSTVIGCLVHGAEHAMRHVGQLSVTTRIVRAGVA